MNKADARNTLDGGGILPTGVELKTELPLDPVVARAFEHPALGHAVVRLELTSLTVATDLEMQVLGFGDGSDAGPVGQAPRRALGFPAAAILEDPDNARYALQVLKRFKKAARRAKSKPGFAKEDFDTIADTLGKSVPHYLPSFYEEASRVLLSYDNERLAGQLFEKARLAERVHALTVDEALRENTFVEFALKGALSIKSLKNYARELARTSAPGDAYATYRRVCVKRTMGGLPPFGAMNAELKRLAKAAKLDVAAEEQRLIEDLLDAPSLSRANLAFFKPYTKTLKAMIAADPAVGRRVLRLFPPVDGNAWLEFLDKVGALTLLPTLSAEDHRGWLEKLPEFCGGWRSTIHGRWFELFGQAEARLKQATFTWQPRTIDIDLTEYLLERGVEITFAHRWTRLGDFDDWAQRPEDEPHRRVDPVHLFAREDLQSDISEQLSRYMGHSAFQPLGLERSAFVAAMDRWLDDRLSRLQTKGTLPVLYEAIEELERNTGPEVWTAFPDHLERFKTVDAARALAGTLRMGIFDELGFRALDEVIDSFGETRGAVLGGVFPHVVYGNASRAVVVGPRERVAEFDLNLEPGAEVRGFVYVQGQLAVIYRPKDVWNTLAVWSSNWSESFEAGSVEASAGIVMDDGSLLMASGRLSAGDRTFQAGVPLSDGTHYWALGKSWPQVLVELDPQTGRRGRASRPAFCESFIVDGTQLVPRYCHLMPLPDSITSSPLGMKDGLGGIRIRQRESHERSDIPAFTVERIDGATSSDFLQMPEALIDLPGRETPLGLGFEWRSLSLREPGLKGSVSHPHYRRGSHELPSTLAWWHAFEVRDEAASLQLRQLSVEAARELLAAGKIAFEASKVVEGEHVFELTSDLTRAVQAAVPGIEDARLLTGIAGLAWMAGKDQRRLEALQDVAAATEQQALGRDPAALATALKDVMDAPGHAHLIAEIPWLDAQIAALGDDPVHHKLADGGTSFPVFGLRGALAGRVLESDLSDDEREAILQLLAAIASSERTHDEPLRWRHCTEIPHPLTPSQDRVLWRDAGAWFYGVRRTGTWRVTYDVMYSPSDGKAVPETGFGEVKGDIDLNDGWDGAELPALLELARHEVPELLLHAPRLAAKTGLTELEACILLLGGSGEHRERLGCKAKPYQFASNIQPARPTRNRLRDGAIRIDPTAPWTNPVAYIDHLAAAWNEIIGRQPVVDPELAELLAAELGNHRPHAMLRLLADPNGELHHDRGWARTVEGYSTHVGGGFRPASLHLALLTVCWLGSYAPVGAPARATVGPALAAIRQRLANPELRFEVASSYEEDECAKFLALIGGEPFVGKDGPIEGTAQGDGFYLHAGYYSSRTVYCHPRVVEEQPDLLEALVAHAHSRPDWIAQLAALPQLDAFAERIATTPVPAGGYECNPALSAPDLVATVAKTHGLEPDAAAYYLQLLALPAPTDRSVKRWNAWKPAAFKRARQALIQAGLVIEAKRSRAGRSIFVHGGWEALKSPYMPLETWKLPLFGLIPDADGHIKTSLSVILPMQPPHRLFAAAWQRVVDGDPPAYEEPGR